MADGSTVASEGLSRCPICLDVLVRGRAVEVKGKWYCKPCARWAQEVHAHFPDRKATVENIRKVKEYYAGD